MEKILVLCLLVLSAPVVLSAQQRTVTTISPGNNTVSISRSSFPGYTPLVVRFWKYPIVAAALRDKTLLRTLSRETEVLSLDAEVPACIRLGQILNLPLSRCRGARGSKAMNRPDKTLVLEQASTIGK